MLHVNWAKLLKHIILIFLMTFSYLTVNLSSWLIMWSIRVHILRSIGIVETEKSWVCFPNLLFINYMTLENYLTLLRFLFLSCRMAKHYLFRRPKRVGIHNSKERECIFVTVSQNAIQHLPMKSSLFLLLELIMLSFLLK